MIELVILACLHTHPAACSEYRIGTGYGLQACMLATQASAATWTNSHPAYDIKRATCRVKAEKA